jgi:glycosyltransferase involved in cell wall biosynthesis/predicted N-acetyltransferase YhbS
MAVRVLWLIKGLGPGGAEHLLAAAASAHDRDRFQIDCAYVLPYKDHLVERLEQAGVRCHCLSTSRTDRRWPLRLRRLIADGHYDIVHAHSPLPAAVGRVAVRTMPRSARPRLVSTEHNAWGTFAVPTRWANRLTARLDDAVFAVSDEARQSMTGPAAAKAVTLQHGIDVAAIRVLRSEREAVRAELGIAPDEMVIGTVANYREQKDYPNLLRAARVLADAGVAARVVAVGQGPLEGDVTALRDELGLGSTVLLTGYRADAARVMSAFDIFTLASRYEGLPVAVMEALALGLPVVATRVGGVAEALTDGVDAVLVPPGDEHALAKAWARVMGDADLRHQLAERAAGRADEFDVRRAVRTIEQTYERLAPNRASEPRAPTASVPSPRPRLPAGLQIREATADDRTAILELCRSTLGWNDDPRFERLFTWKHDENAFGPSYLWVATDGGRIVGLRAFMRWEFVRDGEVLPAVRAVDTATHPDYQGKGLFTAMALHGLEALQADGIAFVFNTPNDKSRPGYLKMGWREVGRLPASVRFRGITSAARSLRARVPAELWSSPTAAGQPFAPWFDQAGGTVAVDEPAGRCLATRWSPDALRWRFGVPELDYRLAASDDGATAVVFRERRRATARELVVLARLRGDCAGADRLAGRLLRTTRADHCLRLGSPRPSAGFGPLPGGGPILTWRAVTRHGMPPLPDWSLTMGDVELF